MSQSTSAPVPLAAAQEAQAAAVLAAALADDPVSHYLIGAAPEDRAAVHRFYAAALRIGVRYGEVYAIGDIDGVAAWLPPGRATVTPAQMLRSGLIRIVLRLGWARINRMMRLANYVEGLHKQTMSDRHWYLMLMGVDPLRQGQGLGGSLIQPVLAGADSAGLACYLESMNERNLAFYRKHGFEVASEGALPGSDLRVWAMVRQPRRQAESSS